MVIATRATDLIAVGRPAGARILGAVVAASLLLCGCERSVLDPKGPIGAAERDILLDSLAIMLAIVIPTIIATLACAWWFRASNTRARFLPQFTYSGRIELLVWSIPLLTITFLGGLTWIGAHELDPARPIASTTPPLEVQVVSLDWKWLFIYPRQGVASVNLLVAPVGTPVHFSLTSASVMNVFFVPQLGSEIYTMNGMVTQLSLKADQPGVFYGLSAHFSGDGFADMNFQMRAVSPAEFQRWAAAARGAGPALDAASYAQLSRQTSAVRPFTYGVVQPDLFQAIATQRIAPGPGPTTGRGGPGLSPRRPEA